jgi:UDP-2,3-diacylglucosamine hydrolase
MEKPIYIVSDNHFMLEKNNDENIRRNKIFNLFNHIKKTGGTLIIGGDFFDFWLESFYGVPNYYDDLLSELKKLHSNNIEIHYVVGNHDYWDFGFIYRQCGIIMHKSDFIFTINDKKILVTHGDGLLKHDYLYRFMKIIIRSKLFILLVRLIPSSIMSFLAKKISNTKSKFNKSAYLPESYKQELEDYATNEIKGNNINTVLMGHYHQLGIKKINDGYFIHLGDWINQYTVTILTKEGIWKQESWNQ